MFVNLGNKHIFLLDISESPMYHVFGGVEHLIFIIKSEDGDHKMMTVASIRSRKIWIWISYLSKACIGQLVNPTNFSIFKEGNHLVLIRRK